MKQALILSLFLLSLISCEINFGLDRKFIGSWKIVTPDNDTLTFIDESSFTRRYYDGISHFEYSYNNDSITIKYNGPDAVFVHPSTHYYELKNNKLMIDFTNGCYGFGSEKYYLTRIK